MRPITLVVALLLSGLLALSGCAGANGKDAGSQQEPTATAGEGESTGDTSELTSADTWEVTLLDGYPEDVVPLYKSTMLDLVYYSVRNDPQWAAVEGGLRNTYHVVYHTDADIAEVREYYKGLMDTIDEESTVGDIVVGTIGKYDVWINTGEQESYNIVYMSVDLPRAEVTEVNPFLADYPADLVEVPACFDFFEDMYYRVTYEDNDMKYTKHFDVVDLDGDGKVDLDTEGCYSYFEERYADKEEFAIDRDAHMVTWVDGKYRVTVAFMADYDRGVLVLGWDHAPGE